MDQIVDVMGQGYMRTVDAVRNALNPGPQREAESRRQCYVEEVQGYYPDAFGAETVDESDPLALEERILELQFALGSLEITEAGQFSRLQNDDRLAIQIPEVRGGILSKIQEMEGKVAEIKQDMSYNWDARYQKEGNARLCNVEMLIHELLALQFLQEDEDTSQMSTEQLRTRRGELEGTAASLRDIDQRTFLKRDLNHPEQTEDQAEALFDKLQKSICQIEERMENLTANLEESHNQTIQEIEDDAAQDDGDGDGTMEAEECSQDGDTLDAEEICPSDDNDSKLQDQIRRIDIYRNIALMAEPCDPRQTKLDKKKRLAELQRVWDNLAALRSEMPDNVDLQWDIPEHRPSYLGHAIYLKIQKLKKDIGECNEKPLHLETQLNTVTQKLEKKVNKAVRGIAYELADREKCGKKHKTKSCAVRY